MPVRVVCECDSAHLETTPVFTCSVRLARGLSDFPLRIFHDRNFSIKFTCNAEDVPAQCPPGRKCRRRPDTPTGNGCAVSGPEEENM